LKAPNWNQERKTIC